MVSAHRTGPVGLCAHSNHDQVLFSDGERHCLRCGSLLKQYQSAERTPVLAKRNEGRALSPVAGAAAGLIVLVLSTVAIWLLAGAAIDGLTALLDQLLTPPRWRFSGP